MVMYLARAALNDRAYRSGARTVAYEGRSVVYADGDELRAAIASLKTEIARATGTTVSTVATTLTEGARPVRYRKPPPRLLRGQGGKAATSFIWGTESAGISDAFNCNRHQSRDFNPTTIILVTVEGFH